MTKSETTTVGVNIISQARDRLATSSNRQEAGIAWRVITAVAWAEEQAVSVRASNRRRWAIMVLTPVLDGADVHTWDENPALTQGDVLAAFDRAIQMHAT